MEVEKRSTGGIILSTESQSEREKLSITTGILLELGPHCRDEYAPGQKITFAKFAGLLYLGKDGREYRMMREDDVTGWIDDDMNLVDVYLGKGIK